MTQTAVRLQAVRDASPTLLEQHRLLKRAYQARYVVLPADLSGGSIIAALNRRYDPAQLGTLEAARPGLEHRLIAPRLRAALADAAGADALAYAEALLPQLRGAPENPFTAFLRATPEREHHYRDFLVQSSADLLAEASASAFGVIGAFGPPQSALFRILIDEFGYGAYEHKHSVLYQALMRDFGLCDEYDAYALFFDEASLALHNTIHFLFQNPRNIFFQVGFLLYAETTYQRSTADHYRYLREFHPEVDARYFSEHAHIDLHHTRMVIDDVIAPLLASYGPEAGAEIVAGAEMTRAAFAEAGEHLLAVSQAFALAVERGQATYAAPPHPGNEGQGVTPGGAHTLGRESARLQVGGLGTVTAEAFAGFPSVAFGLLGPA